MNKYIQAIKDLDIAQVRLIIETEPKWIEWAEPTGKNAIHYLCGVNVLNDPEKAASSLEILKLLLKKGMDINSIHRIPDPRCGHFPATPLWYAYTRGRNEKIYTYLLKNGAEPNHCMFAIAWYDDPKAAALFKKHGAKIEENDGKDTPFLAAIGWKKLNAAQWFLENGADVNITDEKGNTALFIAVKRKYDLDIIEMLLKFDANPDLENNKGISPRKLAASYRQKDILNLLSSAKPVM